MPQSSEKEMPFLDHLEELRTRLFWIIGSLLLGIVVGFAIVFSVPQVMQFLVSPITPYLPPSTGGRLMTTSPTGAFRFLMSAALYIGVVLSLPVIIYQVWAFLSPGLLQHERKIMIPVLASGLLLFILGVVVAFKLALPLSLNFLIKIAEQNFRPEITVEAYFDIAVTMSLAFGAMFELPIVVLALTWLGIVTPQLLSKMRPYAVVILLVVCALLTPPDLLSLSIMFVPVYLLYEVSVVLSYILQRRRNRPTAAT